MSLIFWTRKALETNSSLEKLHELLELSEQSINARWYAPNEEHFDPRLELNSTETLFALFSLLLTVRPRSVTRMLLNRKVVIIIVNRLVIVNKNYSNQFV